MERQLARRHRQRLERNARQLQADEVADALDAGDLGLLHEQLAQALRRQVGAHREDEVGVLEQAAVGHGGDLEPVAPRLQLDGHGARLEHRGQ